MTNRAPPAIIFQRNAALDFRSGHKNKFACDLVAQGVQTIYRFSVFGNNAAQTRRQIKLRSQHLARAMSLKSRSMALHFTLSNHPQTDRRKRACSLSEVQSPEAKNSTLSPLSENIAQDSEDNNNAFFIPINGFFQVVLGLRSKHPVKHLRAAWDGIVDAFSTAEARYKSLSPAKWSELQLR